MQKITIPFSVTYVFESTLKKFRGDSTSALIPLSDVLGEIERLARHIPRTWSITEQDREFISELFSKGHLQDNGQGTSSITFKMDKEASSQEEARRLLTLLDDFVDGKNKGKWLLTAGVARCLDALVEVSHECPGEIFGEANDGLVFNQIEVLVNAARDRLYPLEVDEESKNQCHIDDLEDLLRDAWGIMTLAQRKQFIASGVSRAALHEAYSDQDVDQKIETCLDEMTQEALAIEPALNAAGFSILKEDNLYFWDNGADQGSEFSCRDEAIFDAHMANLRRLENIASDKINHSLRM